MSWRTRSNSRATAWRSRAAVGSSSSTHRAPRASARAISTICSCSTDSVPARRLRRDVEAPLAHDVAGPAAHRAPADQSGAPVAAEEDVLGDRQVRHDHRVLEDRGDPLAPARRCRRRGGAGSPPNRTVARVRLAAGRTGSRRGSTCRRRCGRPGRGTARPRATGRRRAARGWCRTACSTPVTSTSAWPLDVIALSVPGEAGGRASRAAPAVRVRLGRCGADAAVGRAVHVAPQGRVADRGRRDRARAGRRPGS